MVSRVRGRVGLEGDGGRGLRMRGSPAPATYLPHGFALPSLSSLSLLSPLSSLSSLSPPPRFFPSLTRSHSLSPQSVTGPAWYMHVTKKQARLMARGTVATAIPLLFSILSLVLMQAYAQGVYARGCVVLCMGLCKGGGQTRAGAPCRLSVCPHHLPNQPPFPSPPLPSSASAYRFQPLPFSLGRRGHTDSGCCWGSVGSKPSQLRHRA